MNTRVGLAFLVLGRIDLRAFLAGTVVLGLASSCQIATDVPWHVVELKKLTPDTPPDSRTQMHKITFLCSAHRESGLCNAAELVKILRAIEPEVVFQEIRPSDFDFHYKRGNVEALAITEYREFKLFQWVAVDRYDIPEKPNDPNQART